MAKSSRHEGLVPPREAEALGMKESLSWLKGRNCTKCIFETGSKILDDACKRAHDNSYFDTIIMDCIDLFNQFDDVLVLFIHRFTNDTVHLLVKAAHSMSGFREWHDTVPDVIQHVIISEEF